MLALHRELGWVLSSTAMVCKHLRILSRHSRAPALSTRDSTARAYRSKLLSAFI